MSECTQFVDLPHCVDTHHSVSQRTITILIIIIIMSSTVQQQQPPSVAIQLLFGKKNPGGGKRRRRINKVNKTTLPITVNDDNNNNVQPDTINNNEVLNGKEENDNNIMTSNESQFVTVKSVQRAWYYDATEPAPIVLISAVGNKKVKSQDVAATTAPSTVNAWKIMSTGMMDLLNDLYQELQGKLVDRWENLDQTNFKYNFVRMVQLNASSSCQRAIRMLETQVERQELNPQFRHQLPAVFHNLTRDQKFVPSVVAPVDREVLKNGEEWQAIEQRFIENGSWSQCNQSPKIHRIVAHCNSFQASVYELTKARIAAQRNGFANEIMGWHGTKDVDPDKVIQSGGLDIRRANGNSFFGRGVYMAEDAAFVHRDDYGFRKDSVMHTVDSIGRKRSKTTSVRVMLLVKAIVGHYKRFEPNERRQFTCAPHGFDSLYGFTQYDDISMFVVHDNNQLYTCYSIEYIV